MRLLHPLLAAVATATLFGNPAHATFTQVSSLVGASYGGGTVASSAINYVPFNDAVGTVYAIGAAPSYADGGNTVSFGAGASNQLERDQVGNLANPYIDSNFATGTQLIAECGFSGLFAGCTTPAIMSISFAKPVTSFTLSVDDFDTTQPYTFGVTAFNNGVAVGSITASSLADNGVSPAVLAAVSTTPFTTLLLTDSGTAGADGDFVVGNVGFVPEPASIAILGTGVLGLLGMARRRKA